jgi:hypothetical protein
VQDVQARKTLGLTSHIGATWQSGYFGCSIGLGYFVGVTMHGPEVA